MQEEALNELALFAGAGGGILGGHLLGWRTIAAVEIDPYCREMLLRRQRDGVLPLFPIWDDIRTFDGRPLRGRVDVVSGGFPCQDISTAGKGTGITGERSGLWREMVRIVREVRPRFVFVENSPALAFRGLDVVLGDVAEAGFDAEWGVLSACAVGASHPRARLWVASHSDRLNGEARMGVCTHHQRAIQAVDYTTRANAEQWMETVTANAGSGNGIPDRMERTRALGNAQVPLVAATAWQRLVGRIE